MRKRFEALLVEYGKVALVIHLVMFVLVFVGAYIALSAGLAIESTAGEATTWGAAYLAAQITKPFRIGLTLVLTPIIGRLLGRGPKRA